MFYKIGEMEDDYGWDGRVEAGDHTVLNGWKITVTQNGLDCDCGKQVLCPYNIQERVK